MTSSYLNHLRLMQLADSALPIGSAAHSFGLETLVAHGLLTVTDLPAFLSDYLLESAALEGLFCRLAYHLAAQPDFIQPWLDLNHRLSALKLARESRLASATLGKRLLQLVISLQPYPQLTQTWQESMATQTETHHATTFGLVGAVLGSDEELTILAYLQQNLTGLVSASQRLLPLGQKQAAHLVWQLKPTLIQAAQKSHMADLNAAYTFTPLMDWGSLSHPTLTTRLFMS